MTPFDAVVLGLIQGLTEFLPVSSSGHLVIARDLLGIATLDGLSFDAVLQLASVIAVVALFRTDIIGMVKSVLRTLKITRGAREDVTIESGVLAWAIVLGSIPAVLAGVFLEDAMGTVFRSVSFVAWTLLVGSLLMAVAEWVWKKKSENEGLAPFSIKRGFIVGLFQALALMPGISRSGATISGGLILGLTREQAARFSFLLSVPVIAGSGLKKLFDGGLSVSPELVLGFVVSLVVSFWAIKFMLGYVRRSTLMPFVWYRVAVAILLFLTLV